MLFLLRPTNTKPETLKRLFVKLLLTVAVFFSLAPYAYSFDLGNKSIIGGTEKVVILPGELTFKAKIDTGAQNSSMHATDIEIFSLANKRYVRFNTTNLKGETVNLELPVARVVRIKRHQQEPQRRPVVKIGICMGSVYKVVDVSLTDRSKFSRRFLIGESFLVDNFLIDLNQSYTSTPRCDSIAG